MNWCVKAQWKVWEYLGGFFAYVKWKKSCLQSCNTHTSTQARTHCWFNLMNAAELVSYFSSLIVVSLSYWVRDDVECVHNKLHISFVAVISHWVEWKHGCKCCIWRWITSKVETAWPCNFCKCSWFVLGSFLIRPSDLWQSKTFILKSFYSCWNWKSNNGSSGFWLWTSLLQHPGPNFWQHPQKPHWHIIN